MKQLLLVGAPELLKLTARKPETPSKLYLRLIENELDEICRFVERNKITNFEAFEALDGDVQMELVDAYKLLEYWFYHTKKSPAKWRPLYILFDEE